MFRDEYVVVFQLKERTGAERNPDYDKKAGISFGNCPKRLVYKTKWICGVDGPDNLAITQQTSHETDSAAREAAVKLAKANGRDGYFFKGKRVSV